MVQFYDTIIFVAINNGVQNFPSQSGIRGLCNGKRTITWPFFNRNSGYTIEDHVSSKYYRVISKEKRIKDALYTALLRPSVNQATRNVILSLECFKPPSIREKCPHGKPRDRKRNTYSSSNY